MQSKSEITPPTELPASTQQTLRQDDSQFLRDLGARVRQSRERLGMTRKALAAEAAVSERYLAQLETGFGNASIMLLRRVAAALNQPLTGLLDPDQLESTEHRLIRRFLQRIPPQQLEETLFRLMRDIGRDAASRRARIALIGLRGAGKTTLGSRLALELDLPFLETNEEIEKDTGLPLNELFSLYGQAGYRRFERRCLERLIRDYPRAVISVGGGIVAEEEAFNLLLANCHTIWLRARPEEHMARVIAQGDLRPMAGNAEAMEDLKRILAAREALYRQADTILETSGETPERSLQRLRESIKF